jgi:hypothetical protein
MVNADAQLYTMEGIAAGVIMILTAYLVLGSTSVYTPGDTHITDMQLEQVGADVLKIMDTPASLTTNSELEQIVATCNNPSRFHELFWTQYLMSGEIAAQKTSRTGSSIIANAMVYYHYTDMTDPMYPQGKPAVKGFTLASPLIPYSGSESGVRVTRYVEVAARDPCMPADVENRPQVMLVEVFIWKA